MSEASEASAAREPEVTVPAEDAGLARVRLGAGVAVAALAGLPSVLGLAPSATLLDAAELAEQGFGLGVAHPPGEAVAALWGRLFAFLPLGHVALRVAFGQAVAAALAAWLGFRIACVLAQAVRGAVALPPSAIVAIAALTGLFATAPGLWLSAVRPEVYALQAALSLGALLASLHGAARGDARAFLLTGFLLGVGFALHPLIAGLCGVGPALLALAARPARLGRLVAWGVGAFLAGAVLVVYLPLRTAAAPALAWGDARSASGLVWMLAARAFTARTGVVHAQAHLGDTPFVFMEELGVLSVVLALAGAWLSWRGAPGARRGLLAAWLTAFGSWMAAAIGGFDPSNPDIRGYLLVALAGLVWPMASGAAALLGGGSEPVEVRRRDRVLTLAGALAVIAVAWRVPGAWGRARAAVDPTAAAVNAALLDELPAGAVFLSGDFETAFLTGYARTVEGRRPDVAWAHLGFLGGPGYAERLASREPRLAPLAAAAHDEDEGRRAVDALAAHGPVLVEVDEALPRGWWTGLARPEGCVWRWFATSGAAAREDGHAQAGAEPPGDEPASRPAESCARWLGRHRVALTADADEDAHASPLRAYLGWRLYNAGRAACFRASPLAAEELLALLRLLPEDALAAALAAHCQAHNLAM